jgi:hypothetical protein
MRRSSRSSPLGHEPIASSPESRQPKSRCTTDSCGRRSSRALLTPSVSSSATSPRYRFGPSSLGYLTPRARKPRPRRTPPSDPRPVRRNGGSARFAAVAVRNQRSPRQRTTSAFALAGVRCFASPAGRVSQRLPGLRCPCEAGGVSGGKCGARSTLIADRLGVARASAAPRHLPAA